MRPGGRGGDRVREMTRSRSRVRRLAHRRVSIRELDAGLSLGSGRAYSARLLQTSPCGPRWRPVMRARTAVSCLLLLLLAACSEVDDENPTGSDGGPCLQGDPNPLLPCRMG